MQKHRESHPIGDLAVNAGQLQWLPKNPRSWTKDDVEKTVKSILEDEDFLEDRPILATPGEDGKLIVFGGNLRTTAAKRAKIKSVPVVVYCPETDEDRQTILRRAMKDNGSLGAWDFDALANEWDDLPLQDWGVPAWKSEGSGIEGGHGESHSAQEDDFDEDTDEIHVRCKKGDVWELGEHRLVCGDSIDLQVVKSIMGGGY